MRELVTTALQVNATTVFSTIAFLPVVFASKRKQETSS
jgi:hypothetical protein